MTIASASAGTVSIVNLFAAWWWLLIPIGGAVLEWIGERFDMGVAALRKRAKLRRKHQLELKKLELQIAQAHAGHPGAPAVPDLCRHRQAVPVRDNDGNVLAWLCRSCDQQLPAGFSIYEEDL